MNSLYPLRIVDMVYRHESVCVYLICKVALFLKCVL